MTTGTLIAPPEARPVSPSVDRRREYRCECGRVLRVFGGGRHRVYFETTNTRLDDPVMDRVCPGCGRGLPGKERAVTRHATPTRIAPAERTAHDPRYVS